jgi:hypothetical protein
MDISVRGEATSAHAGATSAHAGAAPTQAGMTSAHAGTASAHAGAAPAQAGLTSAHAGAAPSQANLTKTHFEMRDLYCERGGSVYGSGLFFTGLLQTIAFARPTSGRGFGSVKNLISTSSIISSSIIFIFRLITLPAVALRTAVKQSRQTTTCTTALSLVFSVRRLHLNIQQETNIFY